MEIQTLPFIGAGAVVLHDVPDYALIVGNPGRIAGWMCSCGVKLNPEKGEAYCCPDCGKKYLMESDQKLLPQ